MSNAEMTEEELLPPQANRLYSKEGMRPLRSDNSGATLVEALIVLPLFIIVLLVSIDLLHFSFDVQSLRFAAARVMRSACVNNWTHTAVKTNMVTTAKKLGSGLSTSDIDVCRFSDYPCTAINQSMGSDGDLVVLEINVPLDSLFLSNFPWISRAFDYQIVIIGKKEPT